MEKTIQEILQRLSKLRTAHDLSMQQAADRKERAREIACFVTNTVRNISAELEVHWFGSMDDYSISQGILTIMASVRTSHKTIATWVIDASGRVEPPSYTAEEITEAVLKGLKELERLSELQALV